MKFILMWGPTTKNVCIYTKIIMQLENKKELGRLFPHHTLFLFLLGFFMVLPELALCGCEMVMKINVDHHFNLWMGSVFGSNYKAKLVALWGLLHFAIVNGIY